MHFPEQSTEVKNKQMKDLNEKWMKMALIIPAGDVINSSDATWWKHDTKSIKKTQKIYKLAT